MSTRPDQEIRAAILEAAYNAAKKVGSIKEGKFNVFAISKDWGEVKERIFFKRIRFNADYLDEKGQVIWNGFVKGDKGQVKGMIITAEGVEEYEKKHGRSDYGKYGCLADEA